MNEENNIDLSQFIYVLSKRKSMIIVITLVSVLIAAILSFFIISPVYESKATVIVGKANSTTNSNEQYNDVMMYQNLTKTYTAIATSNYIEGKAAGSLSNGMTALKLDKLITVTPETGTQILDITAKANNPQDALNEVTALSNSLVKNAKNVYNAGNIKIMDKGELPQKPVSPKKILNIAIAFILGLIISITISFALEYMDNTLKTSEDVKRYLDLPVLGTIPMQDENM